MTKPALLALASFTATIGALPGLAQTATPAAHHGQSPVLPETPEQKARLAWFKDARLGLFIHWGLYAIPAGQWPGRENTNRGEWIMLQEKIPSAEYEKLAGQFNPVKFDAKAWVGLAKAAGMKYLVVTAKHHDGFCLYDSKLTDYDIVDATPFRRDPLRELAAACREAGIVFCIYYSLPDWHHPEFPARYSMRDFHGAPNPQADVGRYADYMHAQIRELLTNYGPVGIVWFDGGGSFANADRGQLLRGEDLRRMINTLQPAALINNRGGIPADYGTPEQRIPGFMTGNAFEVCMTLNRHWGYNRFDQEWKSPATVVRNIADIVSKGGNYLLNVGPTAEGVIPEESVRILREVGTWTSLNAEAIYGAGPTPFGDELGYEDATRKDGKTGRPLWVDRNAWRCTTQPGRLYFHLLEWPAGESFTLPAFSNRVKRAYLLADRARELSATPGANGVTIKLPSRAPAALAPVLCVEIEGEVKPATRNDRPDTGKDTAS
ncbi:MAG TPA: alpha-L-fucosidase [Opitutaceae bacterium]